MDLLDLLPIVRRRWPAVLAGLAGTLVLALGYLLTTPVTYVATTQLFIATAASDDALELAQSDSFAQSRVRSYVSVANGPDITTAVIADLALPMTPEQLSTRIVADAPLNTVLVNLRISDASASRSARIADAVAEQFAEFVETLEAEASDVPVRVSVLHPAEVPGAPASPKVGVIAVLAVLAGLGLGLGAALLWDRLDRRIHTSEDLATLGVPLLATIPFDRQAATARVAAWTDPHGPRAEAFRQLRTDLRFLDVDSPPKVIVIASPMRGDGRTSVAVDLAASMAEGGSRTCLVDADLRAPALHTWLDLDAERGLLPALAERSTAHRQLQNVAPNLAALVAGGVPPNPAQLLASEQFRSALRRLADVGDAVVVDTAPLLEFADAVELVAGADAVVLVVRGGVTTRDQISDVLTTVARVGNKVHGAVLVLGKGAAAASGGYSYDYRARPEPVENR